MAAKEPIVELGPFKKGLNNLNDAYRLKNSELSVSQNVDIDPDGNCDRVDGIELVDPEDTASAWSYGDLFLCVRGGNLCRMAADETFTVLRMGVGTAIMRYWQAGKLTFYTNGTIIGYISNGISYSLPAPTDAFRVKTPAGVFIFMYQGSIYVGVDNVLYFTDALDFASVHPKEGFKQFPEPLVDGFPVNDGIYISTNKRIWFLGGDAPNFTWKEVANYPAIPGTAQPIQNAAFGRTDIQGRVFLFSTAKGICFGADGGIFGNLTHHEYLMPSMLYGSAYIKTGKLNQYITVART